MSQIADVDVFGYHDGILCGYLTFEGDRCWFELDDAVDPISDDERTYVIVRGGEVVGTALERDVNAARRR